jgi:hypothetical protein
VNTCDSDRACQVDDATCECAEAADCDDSIVCTVDTCGADRACGHDGATCECATHADCDDTMDTTADLCAADRTCSSREVYYDTDMQAVFQAKCMNCHQEAFCVNNNTPCFVTSYAPLAAPPMNTAPAACG